MASVATSALMAATNATGKLDRYKKISPCHNLINSFSTSQHTGSSGHGSHCWEEDGSFHVVNFLFAAVVVADVAVLVAVFVAVAVAVVAVIIVVQ